MLGSYFAKVTARPSFTQVTVIKRINRVHLIGWKICYKDLVLSPYLNLLAPIRKQGIQNLYNKVDKKTRSKLVIKTLRKAINLVQISK